jgi:hypothetical protein
MFLMFNCRTPSASEASNLFLRREFPDLNDDSHKVIFVPDTYEYEGFTEKVLLFGNLKLKVEKD